MTPNIIFAFCIIFLFVTNSFPLQPLCKENKQTNYVWFCKTKDSPIEEFTIDIETDNDAVVNLDRIWTKYHFDYHPEAGYFENDFYRIFIQKKSDQILNGEPILAQVKCTGLFPILMDEFYILC